MDDQAVGNDGPCVRSPSRRGERQNDEVHDEIDDHAVHQARPDGSTAKDRDVPAGDEEGGNDQEGDEEMKHGPEKSRAQATGERAAAEKAGRDALKNPDRPRASEAEEDERIRQVEDTYDECGVQKRA